MTDYLWLPGVLACFGVHRGFNPSWSPSEPLIPRASILVCYLVLSHSVIYRFAGFAGPSSTPRSRIPKHIVLSFGSCIQPQWSHTIDQKFLERTGILFVAQKNGSLRLIFDARRSNCWFGASPQTELATGNALADISAEGEGPTL